VCVATLKRAKQPLPPKNRTEHSSFIKKLPHYNVFSVFFTSVLLLLLACFCDLLTSGSIFK
jgi:hypothetical protein